MATLVLADGTTRRLEIADTRSTRRRGLLGRSSVDGGALLITKCRSVHTIGMKFAIDVAHLSSDMAVVRMKTMAPGRLGVPVLKARHVLEADAGAFAQWGLRVGQTVAVSP
jgi:uncharacterized protein